MKGASELILCLLNVNVPLLICKCCFLIWSGWDDSTQSLTGFQRNKSNYSSPVLVVYILTTHRHTWHTLQLLQHTIFTAIRKRNNFKRQEYIKGIVSRYNHKWLSTLHSEGFTSGKAFLLTISFWVTPSSVWCVIAISSWFELFYLCNCVQFFIPLYLGEITEKRSIVKIFSLLFQQSKSPGHPALFYSEVGILSQPSKI